MNPGVLIDLRDEDFETHRGLSEMTASSIAEFRDVFPLAPLSAVLISEHHLKLLRLERYEHGTPVEAVKRYAPKSVNGLPVVIVLDDGHAAFPGCERLHGEG